MSGIQKAENSAHGSLADCTSLRSFAPLRPRLFAQESPASMKRNSSEAKRNASPRLRPEPKLEITAGTFSQEMVVQLVDDLIVPALVEEFLRSRMNLPASPGCEHNVDQV